MCNTRINTMVTPTKSKQPFVKDSRVKNGGRKTPKSPPNTATQSAFPTSHYGFKTPMNNKPKAEVMRCASEPISKRGPSSSNAGAGMNHRRSITPKNNSPSPLNFAGPKCLEPPTPTSLPRPPTAWTSEKDCKSYKNARQALSFEDLLLPQKPLIQEVIQHDENLSNHLKLLLKVQA